MFSQTVLIFLQFHQDLYISQKTFVHTVTLCCVSNEKQWKAWTHFEHSNVLWQETTSFTFSWLHSFIDILCLPSEIFCITAFFVACSLCSYKYADPELETAHKQATITGLIQNISLGRQKGHKQREFSSCSVLQGEWFSKIKPVCCKNGASTGWLCIMYLSSENLHNLFDIIVHFSGVFISIFLWAFNFQHIIPRFHLMLKLWPQDMFRFQYEVGFEKSFHYRDLQVFHNIQGFKGPRFWDICLDLK